jgi:8-oxo-dGTP pyrophosphatase MutT (NUDIX family)
MTDTTRDLTTGQGWTDRPPVAALPAATVVLVRDSGEGPEALMVRRRSGGTFGGLWVFPGGRVDPGDYAAAGVSASDSSPDAAGSVDAEAEIAVARVAAVREAGEEAGLALAPGDLVPHSHWMPPPEAGRRYSTWFFVAATPGGTEVVVDRDEVREYRWVRPADGISARDAGELPLAPPTWMTLWQLAAHPSSEGVLAAARAEPPRRFATKLLPQPDGAVLMWAGDAAFDDGDLDRPGGRLRLHAPAAGPWRVEVVPAGRLPGGA